jgi:hypothetical protein
MAGKKPAKKNITNTSVQVVEPLGKVIKYYGCPEKPFCCPSCGNKFIKGMMYEYENKKYCSRRCIV